MNIVNFTPYSALTGGIIIGFAVVIFFYFNGRLVGISGIASNALTEERLSLIHIPSPRDRTRSRMPSSA